MFAESAIVLSVESGRVTLTSNRTSAFSRAVLNRTSEDAIELARLTHSLCPAAQAAALGAALLAAQGRAEVGVAAPFLEGAQREAHEETLRSFFRAAAHFCPEIKRDTLMLRNARERTAECLCAKLNVLEGQIAPASAALSIEDCDEETLARLAAKLLTEPDFALKPELEGPRITGALARAREGAMDVSALWAARLAEAETGVAVCARALTLDEGWGVAALETARGLLVHVVGLAGGRIVRHAALAPTEWNFLPTGHFAAAARTLFERQADAQAYDALALSFDPCTRFTGPNLKDDNRA